MKKLPKLTQSGFDVKLSNYRKDEETFDENKMAKIKWFINVYLDKQKQINTDNSSYGLKHILEDHLGFYVSNGECIKAFIDCGFNVRPHGINAYFNVSKKDVKLVNAKRKTGMNI